MNSLQARLKDLSANKKRGWQAELARHCNVAPPSVADWLSGKTKSLDGSNLLKVALFFGVSPDWLATGKGPRHVLPASPGPVGASEANAPAYLPQSKPTPIQEWVLQFREVVAPHRESVRDSVLKLLKDIVLEPDNLELAEQVGQDIARLLGGPVKPGRPKSISSPSRKSK